MTTGTLKVGRTEDGYVVRVEGRGTSQISPSLMAFAEQYFSQAEQPSLGVDLRKCDYLDSTFLGCLLRLHRQCKHRRSGDFFVVADDAKRKQLLAATRIADVLPITGQSPEVCGPSVTMKRADWDAEKYGRHVVDAHRALASVSGPHAEIFQTIADQLEKELSRKKASGGDAPDIRETI